MAGWIDPEIEAHVRGTGPVTVVTPVDALDRWVASDFRERFGNKVSFNPVRTARASVFVQVHNQRRHLIWDKEFFRRLVGFLSALEIADDSDRSLAFREVMYDLASLLSYQEGHLITSAYLAFKRETLVTDHDRERWQVLRREHSLLTGSPAAWRLSNIARLFCYFHESAHCAAAFTPRDFDHVRGAISTWPDFASSVLKEAYAEQSGERDFMHDIANLYLHQLRLNLSEGLARLDVAFKSGLHLEEVTCDFSAIADLVDTCPLGTPEEFADAFVGVTFVFECYDFIETLRTLFAALVTDNVHADVEYHHGIERNYVRGLMLLSELRRATLDTLDQDACEEALFRRMRTVSVRFIEESMRQLNALTDRFLLSGGFWVSQATQQRNMSVAEETAFFGLLREYFLLSDNPVTHEGVHHKMCVRALSLKSEIAHRNGASLDFSEGYAASLSIPTAGSSADILRMLGWDQKA